MSTMDGNPLSAAFTASIVFMINKLTGTGTVIARKAVKHRWLSKGFCCGCVPLRYVFSCHPAVSGPRAHSGSPRGREVLITLSFPNAHSYPTAVLHSDRCVLGDSAKLVC